MKKTFSSFLMAITIALCCTACAKDIVEGDNTPVPQASLTILADRQDFLGGNTRTAYSGISATFEVGDHIGVYVVNGTTRVASNVCFTWDGTKWNGASDLTYDADYDYYAYYPYVASPYTPAFTQSGLKAKFQLFIDDASNKFHQADQTTKAAFNASDLCIAQAVHVSPHVIRFSFEHKKGLAVFNGTHAAKATFSGDNIPYATDDAKYYIMKDATATTFTDNASGTYSLYASSGKYVTHKVSAYLTFVALENGTFSFSKDGLSYSLDDGETWTALAAGANTPTVTAGNKIMWKNNTTLTPTYSDGIGTFSSTGTFEAEGNIMSLYYGDNAIGMKSLTARSYSLQNLFKNSKIVNAQRLLLPATNISTGSYWGMFENCTSLILPPAIIPIVEMSQEGCRSMFSGCTSLTTPPILPATKMITGCYESMFYGCTSLITAPELPATSVGASAYHLMFYGCKSLTTAPELPATTLATSCYSNMFSSCTSLTAAPSLPATTLATACYAGMFYGCTSLTTAPELPATTLASNCYYMMFQGCTSLITAPELPATSLTSNCYASMFNGCTSLTTAPELPATTLEVSCYAVMFFNCSSLNYVKAAFTTTPSSTYTSSWLEGVAATGTFYQNSAATWTTRGVSGIPYGWTVETYTP